MDMANESKSSGRSTPDQDDLLEDEEGEEEEPKESDQERGSPKHFD